MDAEQKRNVTALREAVNRHIEATKADDPVTIPEMMARNEKLVLELAPMYGVKVTSSLRTKDGLTITFEGGATYTMAFVP